MKPGDYIRITSCVETNKHFVGKVGVVVPHEWNVYGWVAVHFDNNPASRPALFSKFEVTPLIDRTEIAAARLVQGI